MPPLKNLNVLLYSPAESPLLFLALKIQPAHRDTQKEGVTHTQTHTHAVLSVTDLQLGSTMGLG